MQSPHDENPSAELAEEETPVLELRPEAEADDDALGRPRRFTEDEVAEALLKCGGIYTAAARLLQRAEEKAGRYVPSSMAPVSRQLVAAYVERSERLQAVCQEAKETTLDIAEAALIKKIGGGSEHMIRFYLETMGRRRGYAKEVRVAGKDGGAVQIQAVRRRGSDALL